MKKNSIFGFIFLFLSFFIVFSSCSTIVSTPSKVYPSIRPRSIFTRKHEKLIQLRKPNNDQEVLKKQQNDLVELQQDQDDDRFELVDFNRWLNDLNTESKQGEDDDDDSNCQDKEENPSFVKKKKKQKHDSGSSSSVHYQDIPPPPPKLATQPPPPPPPPKKPNSNQSSTSQPQPPPPSSSTSSESSKPTTQFSGFATFFEVGLGACGEFNTDSDFIVAVSSDIFEKYNPLNGNPNQNHLCGKQVEISLSSSSHNNEEEDNKVIATVTDECPTCHSNSLDLSKATFQKLQSDLGVGVLSVSWKFI